MIKKFIGLAAVLFTVSAGSWAQDVDFTQAINSRKMMNQADKVSSGVPLPAAPYKIDIPGLFKDFTFTFDSDVPVKIQTQTRKDLAFIQSVKGTSVSSLHKKIFGQVAGADYTRFFNTRITGIGMDDCGSPIAVACVIPYSDSSKMWLTQNYIKFSHPQIARIMVVFHETRHTESNNGNWRHATCPNPFTDENGQAIHSIWTGSSLAGESGCDRTPLGSYGSSMIMLKNIQKFCSNCTDKVRMDAGIYADDQFKRIIDPGAKKAIREDLYK